MAALILAMFLVISLTVSGLGALAYLFPANHPEVRQPEE
jgi:hypothetical protein